MTGTISKILFQKNDYIIAIINGTKVCGSLPEARVGLKVTLYGRFIEHPHYGREFSFTTYKIDTPYIYLASGLVRHVGPALAKKITEKFPDPIKVILNDPEQLTSIKGITFKKAQEISLSVKETLKYRETVEDLAPCALTPGTLIKIHEEIKDSKKVLENPYILTQVDLIGFHKADQIAQKLGIGPESKERITAACLYELNQAAAEGHVYLTQRELGIRVYALLNQKIPPERIEQAIKDLPVTHEDDRLYPPVLSAAENFLASFFAQKLKEPADNINIDSQLKNYPLRLSPEQEQAVRLAFSTRVLIITGGPGTGKTQTIKAITSIYQTIHPKKKIALAAPTGRASRRMEEVTGIKAQTIHMLLGKKIKIDLLIIDESSMLDIELAARLFKAFDKAQIIFVGDSDQLPSVAPGQLLKDLTDLVPTVHLKQVFRQAEESRIVVNAHRINQGSIDLKEGPDFVFINKEDPQEIADYIADYVKRNPQVQVLSFMKKGTLGTDNLNILLQNIIVPGKTPWRRGDRVIQQVNNYAKGVFNGEIGTVIDTEPLTVDFDRRKIAYRHYELDQLSLAYAITVHKAQGSEFDEVLMPLHTQHYIMLSRKILYTGITRARKKVVLIGSYRALTLAVGNVAPDSRNSFLREKLRNNLHG